MHVTRQHFSHLPTLEELTFRVLEDLVKDRRTQVKRTDARYDSVPLSKPLAQLVQ